MNNKNALFRFREGSLLLGSRTYVMGIINVTPDSFSDGGVNFMPEDAVKTAIQMEKDGADILDIGAQSTRPGCTKITEEEEWSRLSKVLPLILKSVHIPISVDTFYPTVAERALELGCHIINDVSGVVCPKMADVVKKYSAGWVLMHSGSESENVCQKVRKKLENMLDTAVSLGVGREYICLDPGIGFGKTAEDNFKLIMGTGSVKVPDNAYLLGASRKRFIGEAAGDEIPFNERDSGTIAAHTIGLLGGADILRVHNVAAAVQGARVADKILKESR